MTRTQPTMPRLQSNDHAASTGDEKARTNQVYHWTKSTPGVPKHMNAANTKFYSIFLNNFSHTITLLTLLTLTLTLTVTLWSLFGACFVSVECWKLIHPPLANGFFFFAFLQTVENIFSFSSSKCNHRNSFFHSWQNLHFGTFFGGPSSAEDAIFRLSSTWTWHAYTIVRDTRSSCGGLMTWKAQIHEGGHRVNFDRNLPSTCLSCSIILNVDNLIKVLKCVQLTKIIL